MGSSMRGLSATGFPSAARQLLGGSAAAVISWPVTGRLVLGCGSCLGCGRWDCGARAVLRAQVACVLFGAQYVRRA